MITIMKLNNGYTLLIQYTIKVIITQCYPLQKGEG